MFTIFLLFIVLTLFSCHDRAVRFNPLHYFPISKDNYWHFNGQIHTMKVEEISKNASEETVTLSFVDSLQVVLWKEKYKIIKNQMRWYSFEPQSMFLPQVNFDPPLLFAPFSDESGELMRIVSIETQTDTIKIENEVTVDYQIQNIEDVKTQAGIFPDCIKMKLTFTYPLSAQRPLFVGEHYWWFAPGIGPVKYDLPTAFGELVEMNVSHLIL